MSKIPPAELQYQLAHIDDNNGPAGVAVISVFGFFALVTLVWRMIVRFRRSGFGIDDYLILAGSVFTFIQVLTVYESFHWGFGKHIVAVPPQNVEPLRKWAVVSYFTFPIALALIKWSILAQIARIFTMQDPIIKFGVWVISVYTFLWLLGQYLAIGLPCQPLSGLWTSSHPCTLPSLVTEVPTILDIISDFAIMLLPQHLIWRLSMSWGKRLAVSFLMALGIFCSITGIVRIVVTHSLNPYDVTYDTVPLLFACLEPVVGVICACLPTAQAPLASAFSAARDGFMYLSNRSTSRFGSKRSSERSSSKEKTSSLENDRGSSRERSHLDDLESQNMQDGKSSLFQVRKDTAIEVIEGGPSPPSHGAIF